MATCSGVSLLKRALWAKISETNCALHGKTAPSQLTGWLKKHDLSENDTVTGYISIVALPINPTIGASMVFPSANAAKTPSDSMEKSQCWSIDEETSAKKSRNTSAKTRFIISMVDRDVFYLHLLIFCLFGNDLDGLGTLTFFEQNMTLSFEPHFMAWSSVL